MKSNAHIPNPEKPAAAESQITSSFDKLSRRCIASLLYNKIEHHTNRQPRIRDPS